ncbi:hypothetical protein SBRCBS47491_007156 [Sporothrix bragantina]|uniref:Uncharacterized protein n=1 Tax=Sporothrix bragantina TaxID=671064 RepID=A0ABP0CAU7_9PEZI
MATRLALLEKTSTHLVTTTGQDSARLMTHSTAIGSIEAKLAGHGAILAKVEAVDLEAMNNFIFNEKPQQQESLSKQEIAVAKLQSQVIATQSALQVVTVTQNQLQAQQQQPANSTNSASASASTFASGPAPSSTPSKIPAPLVFPGDDFPSLRIEISELNEKHEKLETRQKGAISAIAKNTIDLKKLQDELQKDRKSWTSMTKTFGDLLDKETKDRMADSERLKELGITVQQLQLQPAPALLPTEAGQNQISSAASGNEIDMAENDFGPFLSPIPEAVNPVGPVEPSELPAALLAAGAQAAPQLEQLDGSSGPQNLEHALQALQGRMKAAEDDIQAARADFDAQCATLRMMVSTLDSQFNNLTTKELYQAIIGHMEKVFPNPRQVRDDIKGLIGQIHLMKQHSLFVDKTLQKLGDAVGSTGMEKRASAEASGNDSAAEESSSAKRQKVNGTRPSNNGEFASNDSANSSANVSASNTARVGPQPAAKK